jgi:hypothetical protein
MRMFRCSATAITACIILICGVTSFATTDSSAITVDSTSQPDAIVVNHNELMNLPFRSIEEVLGLQNGTTILHHKDIDDLSVTTPRISIRGIEPFENGFYLNGVPINSPYNGYVSTRISPLGLERVSFDPLDFSAKNGFFGVSAVRMTTRKGGSRYSGTVEAITDNTIGSDLDQNWYTATLGGPIPAIPNGYFFGCIERRHFGDRNPSSRTEEFLLGSSNRLPQNWLDGWAYNIRFDYEPRSNVSITGTLDGSITQWSQYLHAYYFDRQHMPYYKEESQAFSGRLQQQVTSSLKYSLQTSYFKSERFRGDGKYRKDLSAYAGGRSELVPHDDLDLNQLFYSWDDMDSVTGGVDESSTWNNYLKFKTSQLGMRLDVSQEIGRKHRIEMEVGYRRYTIRSYQNENPIANSEYTADFVDHYGYDIMGNEKDDGGTDFGNEVKHPSEYGMSLAWRSHFGSLEVVPGLRLDGFDYNTHILRNWENPYGEDDIFNMDDMKPAPTYFRWSPRFLFRYAPAKQHLSIDGGYGLFYYRAPYYALYGGWDYYFNGWDWPGFNSEMEPLEMRSGQLGVTYSFGDAVRTKITGFSNTMKNDLTISWGNWSAYGQNAAVGNRHSWGLESSILMLFCNELSLDLNHTLQWVGTIDTRVSHGLSAILRLGVTEESAAAESPSTIPFSMVLSAESATSMPYTSGWSGSDYIFIDNALPEVRSNLPLKDVVVNLMLQRRIRFAGVSVTPFLWVKNVFNAEVVYYLYTSSGKPDETELLETNESSRIVANSYDSPTLGAMSYTDMYRLAERDPVNFGPPRQVFFGLRVTF